MKKVRPKGLRKAIKRFRKKSDLNCVTWLAFVGDNFEYEMSRSVVCHAGLRRCHIDWNTGERKKPHEVDSFIGTVTGILDNIQNPNLVKYGRDFYVEPEHKLRFIDWLINRSYMKHAYFDIDPNLVLKSGVFWMDPSVNCNYLAHACVANRILSENIDVLNSWLSLVDDGIDENLAFLFAHFLKRYEDGYETVELRNYHLPFDILDIGLEDFLQMLKVASTNTVYKNSWSSIQYYDCINCWHTDLTSRKTPPRNPIRKVIRDKGRDFVIKQKKSIFRLQPFEVELRGINQTVPTEAIVDLCKNVRKRISYGFQQ